MAKFAKGFITEEGFIPEGSKVNILRADGVIFNNVTLTTAGSKALKFQIEGEPDNRELDNGLVNSIEIVTEDEQE